MAVYPLNGIIDSLNIAEKIIVKKREDLKNVKEKLKFIKDENKNLEKEIHELLFEETALVKEVTQLNVQFSLKEKKNGSMNSLQNSLGLEVSEIYSKVGDLEDTWRCSVDQMATRVMGNYEKFRIDEYKFIKDKQDLQEKIKQLSVEEAALEIDVLVQEDLTNDLKILENKIRTIGQTIKMQEEQCNLMESNLQSKLEDAYKEKEYLLDLSNNSDIMSFEDEIKNIREEIEDLIFAIEVAEQESKTRNTNKSTKFLTQIEALNISNYNDEIKCNIKFDKSQSTPKMFTPKTFTRNPPPETPVDELKENDWHTSDSDDEIFSSIKYNNDMTIEGMGEVETPHLDFRLKEKKFNFNHIKKSKQTDHMNTGDIVSDKLNSSNSMPNKSQNKPNSPYTFRRLQNSEPKESKLKEDSISKVKFKYQQATLYKSSMK